jgi:hypothetical protein
LQAETIERAMRAASPDLARRKGKDQSAYVAGTLNLALESRDLKTERARDQSDL